MSYYIEDVSNKPFADIATLLLAHASLLPKDLIPITYAARDLMPWVLFINPGVVGQEYWEEIRRILIAAGNYILIGEAEHWSDKIHFLEFELIMENFAAVQSFIINELWDSVLRLKRTLQGPPEPEPKATSLKELTPYFGPSERIVGYLENVVRADYSNAVKVAAQAIEGMIHPQSCPFPRIRNLDRTTKIFIP